jgi:hypothetical protein
MQRAPAFETAAVAAVYNGFEELARTALMALREIVYDVGRADARVGQIEEMLKWGQPAYLTKGPKSGTTLRLWAPKVGGYGIYVPCSTTLVAGFREDFGTAFRYDGTRGLVFGAGAGFDAEAMRLFIHRAMVYHLRK